MRNNKALNVGHYHPTALAADDPRLTQPLDKLAISDDLLQACADYNLNRIGDIVTLTGKELMARGFMESDVRNLKQALSPQGLRLGCTIPGWWPSRPCR